MNVIAYARFSSTAQKDGSSIERQFELADDYAANNNLIISERLADRARSAYHAHHAKRGELGKIIARAQSGELTGAILLVERMDRLSREKVMAAWDQLRTLTNNGVTIITTTDGRKLNNDTFDAEWSRIIEPLAQMAAAHNESEKKSQIGMDIWKRRRLNNVNITSIPPAWLTQDRTIIPERVAIVREIFDLATTHDYGVLRIANSLSVRNVPPFGGSKSKWKEWSTASVAKIIKSRSVLGEYQPKSKGEPVGPIIPDYFPRIIEPAVFADANQRLSSRNFAANGSGRVSKENIFRHLAFCASCKRTMIIKESAYVRGLRCGGSLSKICEHRRGYRYEIFEEAFLKSVSEVQLKASVSDERTRMTNDLANLELAVATHQKNAITYGRKMLETDSPTLAMLLAEEEAALAKAKQQLEAVQNAMLVDQKPLSSHLADMTSAWKTLADADDPAEVRKQIGLSLQRLVLRIIFFNRDSVVVQLKDGTQYMMKYRRKDGKPMNLSNRQGGPLDAYHWIVERDTSDDIQTMMLANQAEAMKDPAIAEFWAD